MSSDLAAAQAAPVTETPDQMIDKAYGPQMARVKATPETADDLELAQNIAKDAKAMAQDPAMQTGLLRRALALSVEDQEGAPLAEDLISTLVHLKSIKEEAAWQELVKKAGDAIHRRNLGKTDKMLDAYFSWQMQLVRAAMESYDGPAAEKQLNSLATESQASHLKYQADQAFQLIARIRMENPFQQAAAAARNKAAGDDLSLKASDDPKVNLTAGEAILSQTGDCVDAAPFLVRSKDVRWNLILNMHKLRRASNDSPADELLPHPPRSTLASYVEPVLEIPPLGHAAEVPASVAGVAPPAPAAPAKPANPAPGTSSNSRTLPVLPRNMTQADIDKMSPQEFESLKRAMERAGNNEEDPKPAETPPPPSGVKADELVAAAEFLSGMAAPTKRPSSVGKVALLRDAAGLLMQAQSADNAGLSTAQKLELPNKQRAAKEAADKAVADLMTAFDRTSQLPWVNLSSGNIKADWSSSMAYSHWKALD
ncbi:MAG TPA: hypothetical protein VL860_04695, partial [Planctomycetota bacterium]|nr:hypothetical protein [Planctomycetota bacterium]